MNTESVRDRRRFAGLLAATFCLLTLPRLLTHELWRDEAWLWLVVRGGGSPIDLLKPLARSGQGYLFPVLCYLAGRVWSSPLAMQMVHLLLAGAGAYVFARWAPFGQIERALFVLGYFPFYEYAVISRHYAAGVLLLWLACAAARSRRPALGVGAALGLLCQTTVYGYILAIAVAVGWLLDRRLHRNEAPPIPRGEAAAGLVLGLAGAAAGLVQMIPASGTGFAPGWHVGWEPVRALRVFQMPWRAFVPWPRLELHFWNSNLLDSWPAIQAVAGGLLLVLVAVVLRRHLAALAMFCSGAAGLLLFSYLKLIGPVRYHGHLWLLLFAALWLRDGLPADARRRSWPARALLALLIVHVGAAGVASWVDLRHPFSNAGEAARLIRAAGMEDQPLLGHRDPPSATVALALGRPLYSPSRRIFTWYPDWGPVQRNLSNTELRCASRELARQEGRDIGLVLNAAAPPWPEIEMVGSTSGAIEPTEDYFIYRLRYARLQETAAMAQCKAEP